MVPRRPPQPSPALAAEREQVVRAQRRQLDRAYRSPAADQEVAKIAPVGGYRRFGEPAIMTQEPAIALDQLAVRRLVRRDQGEGAFLAQHHEQVRQAPAGRFFPAARRAAVTATPRQMTGEEVRDDPLIANPVAFQLLVQVPAEVNDGVPVIPARPLGIAALTQPLDQPDGLRSERGLLPAHVEQPIPERFVHRPPP
jgi:hypothetical protein